MGPVICYLGVSLNGILRLVCESPRTRTLALNDEHGTLVGGRSASEIIPGHTYVADGRRRAPSSASWRLSAKIASQLPST